jgi:hypothetical protein
MTTRTIKLSSPITWHGETLTTLTLKEPKGRDYIELGEPRLGVRMADGGYYMVEQTHLVKAYLDKCIDHEGGNFLIALMSLADAQALKAALFDFFAPATETPGAPPSPISFKFRFVTLIDASERPVSEMIALHGFAAAVLGAR